MSDYGNGRWGTGSRPMMPGPEQSSYDQGVQDRRFEEERKQREQREHFNKLQREQKKRQEDDRRRAQARTSRPRQQTPPEEQDSGPVLYRDDSVDFEGLLMLGATAGLTFILIKLWGMATGSWAPTQPVLAVIADHGVWGVGAIGIGLGIRFQEQLLPIAKIILLGVVLFFGSAIVVGIYRGIAG